MKKKTKKLALAKETLRRLEDSGLDKVAGARTEDSCALYCSTYRCPTSNALFECAFDCAGTLDCPEV
jgi:hypothetical protein